MTLLLTLGKINGIHTETSRNKLKVDSNSDELINKLDASFAMCNDPQAPCKCTPQSYSVISKGRVFTFTGYKCLDQQDRKLFERIKKSGLNMECKQQISTLELEYCQGDEMKKGRVLRYNSGCELKYV